MSGTDPLPSTLRVSLHVRRPLHLDLPPLVAPALAPSPPHTAPFSALLVSAAALQGWRGNVRLSQWAASRVEDSQPRKAEVGDFFFSGGRSAGESGPQRKRASGRGSAAEEGKGCLT